MTDQVAEQADESLARSPGDILISAREAHGLTTRQVADQLHLLPRQIEALEANDYQQFNGEIFIKGYLRSYSTVLDMDPELLIQSYMDSRPAIIERIPSANRGSQIQCSAKGHSVQYWSLVAIVIVITVLWIMGASSGDEKTVVVAGSLEVVVDKNINLVSETTPDLVVAPMVVETGSVEESPAVDEVVEPVQRVIVEANAEPETVAIENAAIEGITEDILSFSFAQDCWVEVKDSSGKMIFADLRKANATLELSGIGPFDILLGYASGVTLNYNGEPVKIVVNRTKDSARLTVGKP